MKPNGGALTYLSPTLVSVIIIIIGIFAYRLLKTKRTVLDAIEASADDAERASGAQEMVNEKLGLLTANIEKYQPTAKIFLSYVCERRDPSTAAHTHTLRLFTASLAQVLPDSLRIVLRVRHQDAQLLHQHHQLHLDCCQPGLLRVHAHRLHDGDELSLELGGLHAGAAFRVRRDAGAIRRHEEEQAGVRQQGLQVSAKRASE